MLRAKPVGFARRENRFYGLVTPEMLSATLPNPIILSTTGSNRTKPGCYSSRINTYLFAVSNYVIFLGQSIGNRIHVIFMNSFVLMV